MIRCALVLGMVLAFGVMKLPGERALFVQHRQLHFRDVEFNLDLREKIGQLGFIAALSGFRSMVADVLFIQAHVAWEQTEWGRVLLLYRQITTLQPRAILFWDMAAWHMAWNASVAAMNDQTQPRLALRVKAQREYWLQEHSTGWITYIFLALVALIFPDLQTFNLVDDIVVGAAIPLGLFAKTAVLGIFYTTIYSLLAVFVFYGKEL